MFEQDRDGCRVKCVQCGYSKEAAAVRALSRRSDRSGYTPEPTTAGVTP